MDNTKKCDGNHALTTLCVDPQCWQGEDNPLVKMQIALETCQQFNDIGNDLEAYLYELVDWALGNESEKPSAKDYGLSEYIKE